MSSSFWPWSRAFVGINNTSVFCLAFTNIAVGVLHCSLSVLCKALLLASELPTFSERLSSVSLKSSIVWFDEVYSSQLSGIVGHWFLESHICFAFFFAASDINFHISGHTSVRTRFFCFLVTLLQNHENPSRGLTFKGTHLVNPVHASDNSFSPSTFQ